MRWFLILFCALAIITAGHFVTLAGIFNRAPSSPCASGQCALPQPTVAAPVAKEKAKVIVKVPVEVLIRVPCALCPGGYYTMPAVESTSDQPGEGGTNAGRRRLLRGRR